MARTLKLGGLLVGILAVQAASACLWDRDTLADQTKKFPGYLEASVGWFDKNPALYYTMRANRLVKAAAKHKLSLEEYDDLAVALDHTGKSDQAIAWANKKRAVISKMGESEAQDQLYRYHSNIATFQIHKWLAKPNRKDPKLVDESIANLEEAIKINPSAHFGREAVQLNLTKLIRLDIAHDSDSGGPSADFSERIKEIIDNLNKQQNGPNMTPEQRKAKAVEGITGIIVLGYGWALTDLYQLANTQFEDNGKLRWVGELRIAELEDSGVGHVFSPDMRKAWPTDGIQAMADDKLRIVSAFKLMRKKSDEFDAARTKYMTTRLKKGLHPDTDKHFWDGFKARPTLTFKIDEPNAVPNYKGPA